jgi:hypothetical protein
LIGISKLILSLLRLERVLCLAPSSVFYLICDVFCNVLFRLDNLRLDNLRLDNLRLDNFRLDSRLGLEPGLRRSRLVRGLGFRRHVDVDVELSGVFEVDADALLRLIVVLEDLVLLARDVDAAALWSVLRPAVDRRHEQSRKKKELHLVLAGKILFHRPTKKKCFFLCAEVKR